MSPVLTRFMRSVLRTARRGTARLMAAGALVATLVAPAAHAGRTCEEAPLAVEAIERGMQLALNVHRKLEMSGAQVIVIDGGNSLYTDTERRDAWLASKGLRFVGAGVSGAAVFTVTSWVTLATMWGAAALTDWLMDREVEVVASRSFPASAPGYANP